MLVSKLITFPVFAESVGSVLRNNFARMDLIKLIKFMFWTKLWPIKVDSEGTLRHDMFHPATVIPLIGSILSASLVLYLRIPILSELDYTKMSQKIEVGMVIGTIFGCQLTVMTIQASIRCMDASICDSTAKLKRKFIAKVTFASF